MGTPWFKIQHLVESDELVALSANFALYGDLSDRLMSLDGVRRWPTEKSLKYLAARCMLSPSRQATVRGRLCEAMIETSQDIASMAADRPSFEPVAKRMLELWACGLALHSPQHAQKIRDLAGNIENDQAAYEERPRLRF